MRLRCNQFVVCGPRVVATLCRGLSDAFCAHACGDETRGEGGGAGVCGGGDRGFWFCRGGGGFCRGGGGVDDSG